MEHFIEDFINYLISDKKLAENSVSAYRRDVEEFSSFLVTKGTGSLKDASNTEVVSYLLKLKNEGKSSATVNRKMASLRAFYNFMTSKSYISENPALNIKSPKIEKKEISFLTVEEVENLLSQPDDSVKGIRDKAILEVLYAAGMRVSEAVAVNMKDINLRIGFVTCDGEHGKARIIPLGKPSRAALETYIYESRPKLLRRNETDALFLNYSGERLTRQGLWKMLGDYAKKANLENRLTPQILRNSFAVHMLQNGADLKSLQELLGHEDIAATQAYLAVTKNRIKDVYDKTHPRA